MTCLAERPIPPLVQAALLSASASGFDASCSHGTGWLLRTLAGAGGCRRMGESGTGHGVGSAWLLSGSRDAELVTVECDATRAEAARAVLAVSRGRKSCLGTGPCLPSTGPSICCSVTAGVRGAIPRA